MLNWAGMLYDVAGAIDGQEHGHKNATIGNLEVGSWLTDKGEFPYDFGAGPTVYIVFLSGASEIRR